MTINPKTGLPLFAGVAAVLLPLALATAQADPLYNTSRVLPQLGNACLNRPDCKLIVGDRTVIRKYSAAIVTMRCPAATPYFQGWDVRRHEQITAYLIDHTAKSLKVIASNESDKIGVLTVFIGCSAKNTKVTSIMQSAGGFPTKRVKKS